ncbi:MAG: hypothetical protein QG602_3289 [Verrucomicrobiota bacterium]|nr:hypothetical protein [Verrucomicrobiota bacterium]
MVEAMTGDYEITRRIDDALTLRPYQPWMPKDEDCIYYMWLKSYAQSEYGKGRRANKPHTPEEMVYILRQREVIGRLLDKHGARIVCDTAKPYDIYGWACVDPVELAVHYVSIKRNAAKLGFVSEIWDALVGDLVTEPCVVTHELVEMRSDPWRKAGITMPAQWYREEMVAA